MIRTLGLTRHFKKAGRGTALVDAVRGVDIQVEAGELVGFLGPNGAGKTTTLRMLTTLLRPSAGRATVAGRDLLTEPAAVRARIGYVAQGGGTSPESTVAEELLIQGRLYGMAKSQARARAAQLLEQLDLAGLEQRRTSTLSGGQRRRVDVALGLVHAPTLVFLDEPTAGLDPQSRANLWEHARRLNREHNTTLFLTTHYLDEADTLANRILVIDHGEIIAEGSPDVLKARVSGDGVRVGLPRESVTMTAELVSRLPGSYDITTDTDSVRFSVPDGAIALAHLMRAMHSAGITATSLGVQRPTLDDVFFTLTGRSLREPSNVRAPQPSPPSSDRERNLAS
jgi:ABC-2 type transport system ATP-binding protein